MRISVLLADDHNVFRQSLEMLMSTHSEFEVVGQAADGMEVLQLAEQLHPDVVVVDVMMPRLNGLEATSRIRQSLPGSKVILLSMYDDEDNVRSALQKGASGYILKEDIVAHLAQAVTCAAAGERYFSPNLRELVSRIEQGS